MPEFKAVNYREGFPTDPYLALTADPKPRRIMRSLIRVTNYMSVEQNLSIKTVSELENRFTGQEATRCSAYLSACCALQPLRIAPRIEITLK